MQQLALSNKWKQNFLNKHAKISSVWKNETQLFRQKQVAQKSQKWQQAAAYHYIGTCYVVAWQCITCCNVRAYYFLLLKSTIALFWPETILICFCIWLLIFTFYCLFKFIIFYDYKSKECCAVLFYLISSWTFLCLCYMHVYEIY